MPNVWIYVLPAMCVGFRCRFLLESLHDLDKRLRAYHGRLYVVQGQPIAVMETLIRQWNVQHLTFQQDMEPYSQRLEDSVAKVAKISGVKVGSPSSSLCVPCSWLHSYKHSY